MLDQATVTGGYLSLRRFRGLSIFTQEMFAASIRMSTAGGTTVGSSIRQSTSTYLMISAATAFKMDGAAVASFLDYKSLLCIFVVSWWISRGYGTEQVIFRIQNKVSCYSPSLYTSSVSVET